ncbi:MAG: type II secretion system protein GspF, partial [Comamonadaceae bacterium CG_4_9_14_3_um_filter_60_33]
MPVYSFEAISAAGDTRKGVIEADSAKAARGLLRAQALVPLKVEAVSARAGDPAQMGKRGRRGRVFNATALAIWTRQLAGLVSSGLPLERALSSLSDEAEKAPERELVAMLRAEVNGGTPFGKALAQHPREFSDIFVAVIGAGEQSGNLGLVLERLADDLEEQHALKSKLIGAALYPAIVSLVAVVIVLFLVTYVVPQ